MAKVEKLTGIEEVYALAKECGFAGTMEELKAAFDKASGSNEQLDLDAMDNVAGGFGLSSLKEWAVDLWNDIVNSNTVKDVVVPLITDQIVDTPLNNLDKIKEYFK